MLGHTRVQSLISQRKNHYFRFDLVSADARMSDLYEIRAARLCNHDASTITVRPRSAMCMIVIGYTVK